MFLALHIASAVGSNPGSGSIGPSFLPLLIGGLFAWRGYASAAAIERATNRRAWGWSPTGWSVFCFFTGFIGRLCLYFAGKSLLATPAAWSGPAQASGAWIPPQPIPSGVPTAPAPNWGAPPPTAPVHPTFSHGPALARDILPRG